MTTWQDEFIFIHTKTRFPPLELSTVQLILSNFPSLAEAEYAITFFTSLLFPKNYPKLKKIALIKYNLRLMEHDYFPKKIVFGPYTLVRSTTTLHGESPNQYEIQNRDGIKIATFNFYFVPPKKPNEKIELRINNLQGAKPKQSDILYIKKELELLNTYLKENWRIFIVKQIKQICEGHNLKIVGELPQSFDTEQKEHRNIIRQYLQTYLLAGIPISNITTNRVDKTSRTWIQNNLRIKQERQEGKRPLQRTKPKRRMQQRKI